MSDDRASVGNVFPRLWRGELGLARTFWFYFFLVSALANILVDVIEKGPVLLSGPFVFLVLAYLVFAAIGVWRASDRYKGPPGWGFLAKVVVGLFFLQLLTVALAAVDVVSSALF